MARLAPTLALTGLALAASACGPRTNGITPLSNPSLYVAHQPVVERTNYVFDLRSGFGGLSPDERQRLDDWFGSLGLRYGDRVHLDAGDPQLRRDVADLAAGYGLLLSPGAAPLVGGGGASRVIVARAHASVPGCPLWEDELVGAPERASTNYGCATQSNLARMIADPNDLVLGTSPHDVTDPDEASRIMRAYRARAVTTK